jgi:membrane-bound ClpP family serine protease
MDIAIIAGLLLAGVLLFLIEIFLIPGISIAGIAGGLATIASIIYAYMQIGLLAGHITLVSSVLLIGIALFIMFRTNTIDYFSLHSEIDSTVDSVEDLNIAPGDKGVTISRLAPMGKVEVNGNILEAKSEDGFIEEEQSIEVVKILSNNIIVKLKTN